MRQSTQRRFEELLTKAMDARTIWTKAQADYMPLHEAYRKAYDDHVCSMTQLNAFVNDKPKCREIVKLVLGK